MNGGTMKWAFSVIVWTMCGICIMSFALLAFGKITPELFEKVIDKFGTVGFFTMIAQSFLHADFNRDGIPDHTQEGDQNEKPSVVSSISSGGSPVANAGQNPGPNVQPTDQPTNQ